VTDFQWDAPIRAFWAGRRGQSDKQAESGKLDAGTRGAVTGGKHLDALQESIADIFRNISDLDLEVYSTGRRTLPGYYRRSKDWDLVVTYRGALIAAIELKSQVGSFGNNFNNRTEEAIGNAVDLRRAFDAGLLGQVRPWLGFVMVVENTGPSTAIQSALPALFPTDPEFDNTSYLDRYRILMKRLVSDRLYDAIAVIETESGQGIYQEPEYILSLDNFEKSIVDHVHSSRSCLKDHYEQMTIITPS